jgi:hypothetical protein
MNGDGYTESAGGAPDRWANEDFLKAPRKTGQSVNQSLD